MYRMFVKKSWEIKYLKKKEIWFVEQTWRRFYISAWTSSCWIMSSLPSRSGLVRGEGTPLIIGGWVSLKHKVVPFLLHIPKLGSEVGMKTLVVKSQQCDTKSKWSYLANHGRLNKPRTRWRFIRNCNPPKNHEDSVIQETNLSKIYKDKEVENVV